MASTDKARRERADVVVFSYASVFSGKVHSRCNSEKLSESHFLVCLWKGKFHTKFSWRLAFPLFRGVFESHHLPTNSFPTTNQYEPTMENNQNNNSQTPDERIPNMMPQQGTGQSGFAPAVGPGSQQVPPHVFSLMTNPSLAAAAAASPLFPPAAMLSNPGAFLAVPGAFGAMNSMGSSQGAGNGGTQNQSGMMVPNMMMMNSANGSGMTPIAPMGGMSGFHGAGGMGTMNLQSITQGLGSTSGNETDSRKGKGRRPDLTPEERAKQNRDRNREHARSTRLRKKAYVQKLKELVEGLHAERTEEVRQRRVAIQHLAETQNVRRAVVRSFLRFHANFEVDERKWSTILEEDAWLKQPVTPYRSFRRAEIEQVCFHKFVSLYALAP